MRVVVAAVIIAAGIGQTAHPSRLITIDATVTDAKGRTVTDLKPADFDVREGGAAMPLESARLVRVAAGSSEPAPAIQTEDDERQAAGRDDARLFAIFLDEYHVSGGANSALVRDALTRFVDREITPRDLVVVLKPLDSLLTIRMTRDRDAVRRAIAGFEGRRGDYEPRNSYERDFIAGTAERIAAARTQVALSAINALAAHLGSLTDRRKTLIVAAQSVDRADRRRGQEPLPTLDSIIRSANRANVAVYPFDPSVAAGEAPGEGLRRLAEETDGEPIAADAEPGLRRVAADSSAYYLLSFRTPYPDDGKFRALQMRVIRPGVVVRARKGYWTTSPDEALRASLIAKANEPKVDVPLEPAPHASPLIHPWFGLSRGDGGKTRVTFVWEPASRVPGERVRRTPSKLIVEAKSSDGTVLFAGPVVSTGPAAIDEPGATPMRAVFDVPPGRLRLRSSVQDSSETVLDQDVREMSIIDMKSDVAISTAEVLRARTLREFRSLDADGAVPVASREFSRTEHLLIRYHAYGPACPEPCRVAGTQPTVSAKLLDRIGHPIRALDLIAASTPGSYSIDLPLAGFATGDYSIECAASAAGARDAVDRLTFRVTY